MGVGLLILLRQRGARLREARSTGTGSLARGSSPATPLRPRLRTTRAGFEVVPRSPPSGARRSEPTEPSRSALGRLPLVTALVGVGLLICAVGDALSRATLAPSPWIVWTGVVVIAAPAFFRLCSADASVGERVALVCVLGLGLYTVKVMRAPYGYTLGDEFFHAYNTEQILRHHVLFNPNSLLPITSKYPGLEGATSALASMTGMSSFGAGVIVIAAARLTMMLGLFILFLAVSGSARVAGLGAAVFAANSNFLLWAAQFSYQSLAFPLLLVLLAALAERELDPRTHARAWAACIIALMAAVVVTHHGTSYVMTTILVALAIASWIARRPPRYAVWPFALASVALVVTWLVVVASATAGYLEPPVTHALHAALQTVTGEAPARAPFQGAVVNGHAVAAPVNDTLEVIFGYAYVAILLVALPFGLAGGWRRYRNGHLALGGALLGTAFFGTLALRFAPGAWEIGNRGAEFLFVGLAFVLGCAPIDRLGSIVPAWLGRVLLSGCFAVIVVGGAIIGWPAGTRQAQPSQIVAAGHQIESETISLGRWVKAYLPNQSFAAPQADARAVLLYGETRVLTSSAIDSIVSDPALPTSNLRALRAMHVRYLVVDRRVRGDDITSGYYFTVRPPWGFPDAQLSPKVAARFDQLRIPLVFDSGDIRVYDLVGVP